MGSDASDKTRPAIWLGYLVTMCSSCQQTRQWFIQDVNSCKMGLWLHHFIKVAFVDAIETGLASFFSKPTFSEMSSSQTLVACLQYCSTAQ
jgi:hypothetical protein